MWLYLSSYKLGNEIEVLKKWIKEHGNNIILIANSRDWSPESQAKEESILRDCASLEEIGFNVKRMDLREYFGEEEQLRKETAIEDVEDNDTNSKKVYNVYGQMMSLDMKLPKGRYSIDGKKVLIKE